MVHTNNKRKFDILIFWLPLFILVTMFIRFALSFQLKQGINLGFLKGFLLDSLLCSFTIFFMTLLKFKRMALMSAFLGAIYLVLNFINYITVKENESLASFEFADLVFNKTFMLGSGVIYLVGAIVLIIFFVYFIKKSSAYFSCSLRSLLFSGLSFIVLLGTNYIFQPNIDPRLPDWQSKNFLWELFNNSVKASTQGRTLSLEGLKGQGKDLSGVPILPMQKRPYNVLLLLLESIPGASLEDAENVNWRMDNLSSIAHDYGFKYTNFFAHNRQTHRGEYAILCGNYPNLSIEPDKMKAVAMMPEKVDCLPKIMKEQGYQTIYMQSADMGYMGKDVFMPAAGFNKIIGRRELPTDRVLSWWGVDDDTLLSAAFDEINVLQKDKKPWFMTLLTVGTHHPYAVPKDFRSHREDDFGVSVDFLDQAVKKLFNKLQTTGVLDNTLVIITADESKGGVNKGYGHDSISQLWVPFVVITPEKITGVSSDRFYHKDIAFSILDYLGIDATHYRLGGRSIFRKYLAPEKAYFANIYLNILYEQISEERILVCQQINGEIGSCKAMHADAKEPVPKSGKLLPANLSEITELRNFLNSNEVDSNKIDNLWQPILSQDRFEIKSPKNTDELLKAMSYFDISPKSNLEGKLVLEAHNGDFAILARLVSEGAKKIHNSEGWDTIREGESFEYSVNMDFDELVKNAEFQLMARRLTDSNGYLLVKTAKYRKKSLN